MNLKSECYLFCYECVAQSTNILPAYNDIYGRLIDGRVPLIPSMNVDNQFVLSEITGKVTGQLSKPEFKKLAETMTINLFGCHKTYAILRFRKYVKYY